MIIQCDQCKTKFRLDDSRVTDAGVKVRCSRCKSTFVVKKEESEDVVDTLEASKGPESPESKTEKQDNAVAFLTGQKTALPEDENGEVQEIGSSLTGGLPPVGAAQDKAANNGNRAGLDDFGFAGSPFADSGTEDKSTTVEHRIVEEKEEGRFECPGADFAGFSESGTDEGDTGSFRLGMEDSPAGSGKDASDGSFFESQDFPAAEDNFSQSVGSEAVSDQSWDIFPPVADPEAEEPAAAGKELFFKCQEQNVENHGSISTVKDDGVLFSPEAGEGDNLQEIMFAAPGIKKPSSPHIENAAEANEEDLPPLAISSRRKRSLFSPAVFAVLLLTVIAAGGAAYYFSWFDFSSFNIPALSGITSRPISNQVSEIAIRNLDGTYLHNVYGGEIFVVTGEAFNNSGKALTSVRVQGYVYGEKGEVLLKNPANFMNTLSRDQLTTLPVNEIEALLKNNSAKSPDDTSMQPGTAATFQIVFTHVPEGAGEFGAEVAGSKVAKR
jgi:predicted Zn finger-like uncharacterized protein